MNVTHDLSGQVDVTVSQLAYTIHPKHDKGFSHAGDFLACLLFLVKKGLPFFPVGLSI